MHFFTQQLASEGSNLSVLSRMDLDESSRTTERLIVVFFIFSATLSVAFLIAVTWRIVRPLQHLKGEISRLGAEGMEFRLSPRRADEIGDVVISFNRMADRLQ